MHGNERDIVTGVPPDDPELRTGRTAAAHQGETHLASVPPPPPSPPPADSVKDPKEEGPEGIDPACAENGLDNEQVAQMRDRFGPNEVKTKQTPEWKKIARRFSDWICILIVRPHPHYWFHISSIDA